MNTIKIGDRYKCIKESMYFTKNKIYKVKFDTIDCYRLENLSDSVAFFDDCEMNHYCSKDYLYDNFAKVEDDLEKDIICKGIAIKWGEKICKGIMSDDECIRFKYECGYFSTEINDVINEINVLIDKGVF